MQWIEARSSGLQICVTFFLHSFQIYFFSVVYLCWHIYFFFLSPSFSPPARDSGFYMVVLINVPSYREQVCLPLQGEVKAWSLNPASAPNKVQLLDFSPSSHGSFPFCLKLNHSNQSVLLNFAYQHLGRNKIPGQSYCWKEVLQGIFNSPLLFHLVSTHINQSYHFHLSWMAKKRW